MKVGTRLTSGFLLLTLLMGLVGYIAANSTKRIQQNNQIELNERKLTALLDRSLVLILQLIETKNLSEYNRIKLNLEDTRKEFDLLHKETKQSAYGFLEGIGDFEKSTGKFTIISNGIIGVHKEKLIQNKELAEKEALEKNLRYNAIRIPLNKLNNPALIISVAFMEYYSKEAIYQYKDLQHINEWLDSIQTTKSEIEQFELQQDQKNSLLQNITSYQFIAKRLGEIVIDQKKAEDSELLEVDKLTEIIKKLQVDKEKIISNIHAKNSSLANRILKTLLIEIIIMLFIAVFLGLYIARSISKPIIELRDLALKISRGQWGEKIKLKSRDEIGELGTAFNKMTEDLQKTTVSVKVLEEEQRRFQDVTRNTGDWIWEVDDQGRYTYVSLVAEEILGYKPQEMIGKYFYDFFHPDDKEELKKATFEVFSKKEEFKNFLNRNIRKDGQIILIETTGVPVVDENGRLFGYRGAGRDISERKKAEEKLKESEEQYRIFASYQEVISELRKFYMVDTAFEQMVQKTLDLIIEKFGYYMAWYAELIEKEKIILPKLWAGKYEKYLDGLRLEYESDERDAKCAMSLAILTKKPFGYADLEHDKDFEKWRAFALQYGYRSNQAIPFIVDGKCKSAFLIYSTRPFAFSEKLVEYLKGIIDELATIIQNITERKKTEEVLRKREEEYRDLFENANDLIFIAAPNGSFLHINHAWQKTLGYSNKEISKLSLFDIIHSDSRTHCKELFQRIISGEEISHIEAIFVTKDGKAVVVEGNCSCRFEKGMPISIRAIFRDITEHKKAEEALRASEIRNRILLENLPQKIFLKDRNSVYISCNENYARDLKIKPEEIAGKTDYDFHPKELAEKYRADDKRIMDSDKIEELEEKYIQEGQERFVHTEKVPVKDEQGNVVAILGIFWDITERRQAEEELRLAYKKIQQTQEELIQASKMAAMGQLAAGIAHELNQPLTGIKGFAQAVLMDLEKESPFRNDLNKIVEQVGRIDAIIKNVRFFARKSDFKIVELDINQVITDSLMLLNQQLNVHNIRVIQELGSDIPKIQGDPNQLQQAFLNIISNSRDAILSLNRPEGGVLTAAFELYFKSDLSFPRLGALRCVPCTVRLCWGKASLGAGLGRPASS